VTGKAVIADPISSCKILNNGKEFWGNIAIVQRGDCMFVGNNSCHLDHALKIVDWHGREY
jgi:hypothetical protein